MSVKLATTEALAAPGRGVSRIRRTLLVAAVVAGVATPLLTSAPAEAVLQTPRAPVSLPQAIEPLARYDTARICSPTAKPGAVKLMALLLKTYPGSRNSGISRACTGTSRSEHKEGRAVDFGVRAWVPAENAIAESFLRWATATDARGNTYANARRLGIMYMIWDDKIWTASRASSGWQPYRHSLCRNTSLRYCGNTYRHRDHIHISLSWAGARATTSFWTGRVSGTPAPAPAPAPTTSTSVTPYRHLTLRQGTQGPGVVVVQRILGVSTTGNFGPLTQTAVVNFQRAAGLPAEGVVGPLTWAALEKRALIAPYRNTVLERGDRGPAVTALQKALGVSATGFFGDQTVAAVKAVQRRAGLVQDGDVGPRTWTAIGH